MMKKATLFGVILMVLLTVLVNVNMNKHDVHAEEHVFGERVHQIVVIDNGEIVDDCVYLDGKVFCNYSNEENSNIEITKTVYHGTSEDLLGH